MATNSSKVGALILTKNEERHIGGCLEALAWVPERVVVDAGSSDQTRIFTEERGARFIEHCFVDFAAQRNYAMSLTQADWILFIDADERVSKELAEEIQSVIQGPEQAYRIPRHNYFFGKRLKYSGGAEDAPLRLFPRASGVWRQPVHEYFETNLPVIKLKSPLIHHTTRDLAHYMEKVARYVPLEIETMRQKGRSVFLGEFLLRPVLKFFYLYLWKLGFLDGVAGFQYAALSAYYDFCKYRGFSAVSKKVAA